MRRPRLDATASDRSAGGGGTITRRGRLRLKTPEQGAATSVLLAASPLVEGVTGRYFEDCREAQLLTERPPSGMAGLAPDALDRANADRLWELSLRLLG